MNRKFTMVILIIMWLCMNPHSYANAISLDDSFQSQEKWMLTDKVIVKLKRDFSIQSLLNPEKEDKRELEVPQGRDVLDFVEELQQGINVLYAEPIFIRRILNNTEEEEVKEIPNDPCFYNILITKGQWGLEYTEMTSAWENVSVDKRNKIVVAVLDTGADLSHEDLKENIVEGYDFINEDSVPMDDHGHGTHVAGIIGASTNNAIGISGVAGGVKIMPIKVLDEEGSGNSHQIASGIKWAVDQGADVINMSLGAPRYNMDSQGNYILDKNGEKIELFSQIENEAIQYALNHNVVVVAAAGNDSNHYGINRPAYAREIGYPAYYNGVLSVGAIGLFKNNNGSYYLDIGNFSNIGPELDVVAPGVNIISTALGFPKYDYYSGTSQATPFVSGLVALIKAVDESMSVEEAIGIIKKSAQSLDTNRSTDYFGTGLINGNEAVKLSLFDVNRDLIVDFKDVINIAEVSVGKIKPREEKKALLDTNKDNIINILDGLYIKKYYSN